MARTAERQARRAMSRVARDVLVPLAVWLAATLLARAAGFRMDVPWHLFQLLDPAVLGQHPLAALCYLHSQPPGFNALAALVLAAAGASGATPETIAALTFAVLGAVGAVALHALVRHLTGSRLLAAVALLFVVADPSYHVYANIFFYEFVLCTLLLLLVTAGVRFLDDGSPRALAAATLLLAGISLTRTLFHPLWAVGFWCLLPAMRRPIGPVPRRAALALFALLVASLAAWPAKNAVVYGRFIYASMSAFSLARDVPGCDALSLGRGADGARLAAAADDLIARAEGVCGSAGSEALTSGVKGPLAKSTGNWNGVAHLMMAPAQQTCATRWMREHPGEWLGRTAGQYAMWMRPAFVESHWSTIAGPDSPAYWFYAHAWERTLFADLRPLVETAWPGLFLHRYAMIAQNRIVPYTLYGFVLFPLLMGALAVRAFRRRDVGGATAVLLLAVILWPMVAACLTDGLEGNRMRFATTPLVVLAACMLPGSRARPSKPSSDDRSTAPGSGR